MYGECGLKNKVRDTSGLQLTKSGGKHTSFVLAILSANKKQNAFEDN